MQDTPLFIAFIACAFVMIFVTIQYVRNEQKIQQESRNAYNKQQEKFYAWQRQNEEMFRRRQAEQREKTQKKKQENINPEDIAYTQKLFVEAYQQYEAAKKATQRAQIDYINAKQQEEQASNTFEHAFHAHEQAKKGKYTRPSAPDTSTDIHPSLSFFSIDVADHALVRRTYIALCKKHHPDMVSENERAQATEKVQEINMHYERLCSHYQWR